MALLVASSLAPLAAAGSKQYVALAAALAIAVGAIREVQTGLHSRNITFEVAHATDELLEQFDATGLTSLLGPEHLYGTVAAAVEACERPAASISATATDPAE